MPKYLYCNIPHTQKGKPKKSLSANTGWLWKDLPIVIEKQRLQIWLVEAAPHHALSLLAIHAATVS